MVKRFLITTALEETWCQNEPVLFLGDWCQLYSRRDRWSKMDAEVLPYHWDDRTKLYADYQYLSEFHERLLISLTAQLNQIHGVDHNLRYWRILIGPWLGCFVQILFDRWTSIQLAVSQYELSGTISLTGREECMIPNDMRNCLNFFHSDEWNHHLCAVILQDFTSIPCVKRVRPRKDSVLNKVPTFSLKRKIKNFIRECYSRISNILWCDQDVFFLNTYLPPLEEIRLCRRLREIPKFWTIVPAVRAVVNKSQRQWEVLGDSRSDFEACARKLIPSHIPRVYLEGYWQLIDQARATPWPKQPKIIWTSNAHLNEDVFKAWAAEKAEKGFPLVIGQHGGHYGTGQWSFNEDHELAISDCYLSWGWSSSDQSKIKPVGQLKVERPLGIHYAQNQSALLVTGQVPRYSYNMRSTIVAGQYHDYFNDQCNFVKNLPAHIYEKLTVRLHPSDLGQDQISRWLDIFPSIILDDGRSSIKGLISQCRLYIATYNATTFLQSFSMNVPTVIYWNPCHWELRDSAIPYFEDLKRVGIFHDTPEAAALHVATIWHDVETWWNSSEVEEVLLRFKKRYCNLDDNTLYRVEDALRSVITEYKRKTVAFGS
jgi:putative transferase (TIGR04331 family)